MNARRNPGGGKPGGRAAILAARWEELTDDLEAAAARAGLLPALPAAAGRGADVGVPGARQAATGDQVSLS